MDLIKLPIFSFKKKTKLQYNKFYINMTVLFLRKSYEIYISYEIIMLNQYI